MKFIYSPFQGRIRQLCWLSLEKFKKKLKPNYVQRLEKFIEMLNDNHKKFHDERNNKIYPNYKAYKINNVKFLVYNNSDPKQLQLFNSIELKQKVD